MRMLFLADCMVGDLWAENFSTVAFHFISSPIHTAIWLLLGGSIYTDVTYEEYVEKYFLAPLNMTNTGFNITTR